MNENKTGKTGKISDRDKERSRDRTDDMKKELLKHPAEQQSSGEKYEGTLRQKKGNK